jgi:BolA protein
VLLHLQVINESGMHNVPRGSETHFKVVVVSRGFEAMTLIKRHRTLHGLLAEELGGGVHALSLLCKTPDEWEKAEGAVPASPACMGGSKR